MDPTTLFVPRTCTELVDGEREPRRPSRLAAHRGASAYVLLAEAGAGKTRAFEEEASETGACYVTARDFITFDDRAEWHDVVLFIDGLDEVRAGVGGGRAPLDEIRRRLDRLGRPCFRLSCREADWFGTSDRAALERVAPGGSIRRLRLDPLRENDILGIVARQPGIADAGAFMETARQRGVLELLGNPLLLSMFIEIVARDGTWLDTRRETYEKTCTMALREVNEEHEAAWRQGFATVDELLDAAGFLCAVQLIANLIGHALVSSAAEASSYYDVRELGHPDLGLLRTVLLTKLFKPGTGDGQRREPLHRTVAEYLAARYLAGRIKDAVPPDRVRALLSAADGGVVSALRGLHAWLAVLCEKERAACIGRDPLGVVLYGDVADFSQANKKQLLRSLECEARRNPWSIGDLHDRSRLAGLYTPDMEGPFREILRAPVRGDADQALVSLVLEAMLAGAASAHPVPELVELVRDSARWTGTRVQALRVLLRVADDVREVETQLVGLREELREGEIEDASGRLLVPLLRRHCTEAIGPDPIGPSRVFDYLRLPRDPRLLSGGVLFWTHDLLEWSSHPAVLSVLLDELVARGDVRRRLLGDIRTERMPGELLARGLDSAGDAISDERLYDWLGVTLDSHSHPRVNPEAMNRIAGWLAGRPARYEAVIAEAYRRCEGTENPVRRLSTALRRLQGIREPAGIGRWYLRQAEKLETGELAEAAFARAVGSLWWSPTGGGLTLDELEAWARRHPAFWPLLERHLLCPVSEEHYEHRRRVLELRTRDRRERVHWNRAVEDQVEALREGNAPPALLDGLATAYFGRLIDAEGEAPKERLRQLLGGRGDLVAAALAGLRNSIARSDLPSVTEIVALHRDGQRYHIALPYLAGVEEHAREAPERVLSLGDAGAARAVAFQLLEGAGEEPPWLVRLLRERPEVVAGVLIKVATVELESNRSHVTGLYELALDERYRGVARHAVGPLLERFPVRAAGDRTRYLGYLLKSGLRHLHRWALASLIERKLALSSMAVAQRVSWLAAGLAIDASRYAQRLEDYVRGQPRRLEALADFFARRDELWSVDAGLTETGLVALVEVLAPYYAPYRIHGIRRVTLGMEAADRIRHWIERLSGSPGVRVGSELERLAATPALDAWQPVLADAAWRQAAVRREAEFSHPDPQAVVRALANHEPASPADLAALTVAALEDLAREIRHGNTDDYKQFWNVDARGRPETRRPETIIQRELLSRLRPKLSRYGVDAQPEGHYADAKRADIRVAFGRFNLPVEIKRDDHPDLWSAMRTQLMARYTRDPGACGYGVYLVLWFGGESMPLPPDGHRPRTADELHRRLVETLRDDERHRISVCVIDCAKPTAPGAEVAGVTTATAREEARDRPPGG